MISKLLLPSALVASVGALAYANLQLPATESLPLNPMMPQSGQEWQIIYVGNSKCWPSNRPGVADAVRNIITIVGRETASINESLLTLGIATDADHKAGSGHLEKIGAFDGVSLGGGWRNQSLRLVQALEPHATLATPTLILVSRGVEISTSGQTVASRDSVRVRLVGVEAITRFADWLSGKSDVPYTSTPSDGVPSDATPEAAVTAVP